MSKTYTWPELFAVVKLPRVGERSSVKLRRFIMGFKEKHRRLVALALSVAHWHPINHAEMFHTADICDDACGLCAVYRDITHCGFGTCSNSCSLVVVGKGCVNIKSPWRIASAALYFDRDPLKFYKAATVMYNVLEKLYSAEYSRLETEGNRREN